MKQEKEPEHVHSGIVKERDILKAANDALHAELEAKDRRIAELEAIIRGVTQSQVKPA